MKKRFLCLILALAMALGNIGTTEAFAKTTEVNDDTGLTKLAAYSAAGTEELHRTSTLRTASADTPTEAEIAAAPVFAGTTEAGEYLRRQMKQRVSDIVLRVSGAYDEETISVFHEAIRYTGVSDEGDALDCQRDTTKTGVWRNTAANECVYRYSFTYRTTLEEEQELKDALKRIEAEIPWGSTADEEMHAIRGVYRYLIETYSYDYDSYEKHKQGITAIAQDKAAAQSYVAYGAYKQKKAVCQGLAELLYRILLDRGIDNRILFSDTHAWNAVKVEGEWYMCDATGDVQKGFKDVPEHYLISRSDLAAMGNTYNWNANTVWDYSVVDAYDWAAREWYDLTASVIRDFKKVVKLVKGNKTGKQKATLTDSNGKKLKEGRDYTVSYEYGSYEDGRYNAKAIYTGTGDYSGSVEKYYNRTLEAPKIIKIEQRVAPHFSDGCQYTLENCIYAKLPDNLASFKHPLVYIYFRPEYNDGKWYTLTHAYMGKDFTCSDNGHKYTYRGVSKKMKDGTYRFTIYTDILQTKHNSKTVETPTTLKFFVATEAIDYTVRSYSKLYTAPTLKGTFKVEKKRVYNAAKLKKLKQREVKAGIDDRAYPDPTFTNYFFSVK